MTASPERAFCASKAVWASFSLDAVAFAFSWMDSTFVLSASIISLASFKASFLTFTLFVACLMASARLLSAFLAVSTAVVALEILALTCSISFSAWASEAFAWPSPEPFRASSAAFTFASLAVTVLSASVFLLVALSTFAVSVATVSVWALIASVDASVDVWFASWAFTLASCFAFVALIFSSVAFALTVSADFNSSLALVKAVSVVVTTLLAEVTSAVAVSFSVSTCLTVDAWASRAGLTSEDFFTSGFALAAGLETRAGSLTAVVSTGAEIVASWANAVPPTDASAIAVEVVSFFSFFIIFSFDDW